MKCLVCGRHLSSRKSGLRGVGPVCIKKERREPYLFAEAMPRLAIDVVLLRGADGAFVASQGRIIE